MFSGDKSYLILFLGVFAAGLISLLLKHFRRNRLRRIGVKATANVMDVTTERILRGDAGHNHSADAVDRFVNERKYTYTFYYNVGGNDYTHELTYESWEQSYRQGEAVDIYYNPDNPKEMMVASEVTASSSPLGIIGPFLAVAIAIILFFLLRN